MGFTKPFRRKRKTRHKVLSGFNLFNHHRQMASFRENYLPPAFYDAMKAAPPLQGPFHTQYPPKAIFPDDSLRRKLELKTDHGKEVSRMGVVPVPWWFMNRPIDSALKRVKEIRIENPDMTENEALAQWDIEFYRMKRIRVKEMEILSENAQKDGQHITIFDSFNLIRLMKDMQVESSTIREYRIQRARREQSNLAFTKEMPTPSTILDLKEFKKSDSLHLQMNTTQKRKMAAVSQIRGIVQRIQFYKSRHREGLIAVDSNYEPNDLDYVDAFVKAYDVDKIPATSPDWGKEKAQWTGQIEGMGSFDFVKELYAEFKEEFNRFSRLVEITFDIGKFTSSLDLGFATKPFSQTNVIDLYSKHGLYPVDISRYVMAYRTKRGYDTLTSHQKKLEEMIEFSRLLKHTQEFNLQGFHPRRVDPNIIKDINNDLGIVAITEDPLEKKKNISSTTGINLQDVVKLLKSTPSQKKN